MPYTPPCRSNISLGRGKVRRLKLFKAIKSVYLVNWSLTLHLTSSAKVRNSREHNKKPSSNKSRINCREEIIIIEERTRDCNTFFSTSQLSLPTSLYQTFQLFLVQFHFTVNCSVFFFSER